VCYVTLTLLTWVISEMLRLMIMSTLRLCEHPASIIIIIIIIIILLLTTVELSFGGSSPYTSTNKTEEYTYIYIYVYINETIQKTQYKQHKTQ